jgi:hypothetical protein
MLNPFFSKTISLVLKSLYLEKYTHTFDSQDSLKKTEEFVLMQIDNMPDYFRLALLFLIIIFNFYSIFFSGNVFYRLNQKSRLALIIKWRTSRLRFKNDFIFFFESLVIFDLASKEFFN